MYKKVKNFELKKTYNSHNLHNESFENKKCGESSIAVNTYTEKKTCEKDIEQNRIDSYSRNNVNQKRKTAINDLADISMGNNCNMDNDNVATKKPKKKKKHNKSLNLIEFNTNNDADYRTYEEVDGQNINDSDYRGNINQSIKSKLNASIDISLENKCNTDNDIVATKKPKKKKKHNKSLNLIEFNTNNDADYRTYEEVDGQNINGSDYGGYVNQTIKSELNTSTDISLENKCSTDNENVATKKPKKKKKYNKSLNSTEFNTNNDADYRTYEEVDGQNINGSDYGGNVNQTMKSELNTSTDISLENKCSSDNENVATKKPKKKKKHNTSLNSIEFNTNNDADYRTYEEVDGQNINGSADYGGNVNQTVKSELNTSTDISLENKCSSDNENVATKKPKKKKKHNTSLNSIELYTNNDADCRTYEKDNEENCIDSYSRNVSRKRKFDINAVADISLGDNCSIDNNNVPTKKTKKMKNHDESLNSIEINTYHDTEIKTFESTCNEAGEQHFIDSDSKALTDTSLAIDFCIDSENVATKKSKKGILHHKIKATDNINSMKTKDENKLPMISQNHNGLKTLLNSMESCGFDESLTDIKTKFNLMNYLTNKDSSLKNHPDYKLINEHLSKKIKLVINNKCQIGASDILLLKVVGKIILKKIVEKINSAQDIKHLMIKLPPECKDNKIHFIETCLSRLPSKDKMDIIKKLNPLVKLGVFNKDEDNMIREYWSKFQKEYNISNILPFLSNGLEMTLSLTERLQFIRYISAGLPNRILYSVFKRFNILFIEYEDKTCFSEEEDQLIMKVDKCDAIKNKFSVLSLILNRTRLQLYRRHEVLKNQHIKCKKFIWDDQKRQELFTNILLETNTEHWKQLKNLTITKNILIKIAKNLGEDVNYHKVRYQWNYLYTMLFCEKPILKSTFNLNTFELLEKINPKHWSDLNWEEITNKLYPGANSKIICTFFHSWIDRKVPSDILKNVGDTLDYLRSHVVDKLKNKIAKHGEREFPRLRVKHYDLLVNNQ